MDYSQLIMVGLGLTVVELSAGIAMGWWMRGGQRKEKESAEQERARAALEQLHLLASTMKADVGEHSSRVQAISDELQQTGQTTIDSTVMKTVAQIIQANQDLQQQLATAEEKLQEQAEEIQVHVATSLTDALTGIANRRAFDNILAQRFAEFKRRGTPVSLAMIDVDHFKKFNDQHGHQVGDEALQAVAANITSTMREMDTVARYGGEEFAVIMPSSVLTEAQQGAERARINIAAKPLTIAGKSIPVTASVGVAEATKDETVATLIQRADAALYHAKHQGRNRVSIHDGSCARSMLTAAEMRRDEPRATDGSTFDALGLPTRTAFCEDVRRHLAQTHCDGTPMALLLVKLDRMSDLVKRYGPSVEIVVTRAAAQFLRAELREGDKLTRYDETTFGLLLPCTPLPEAQQIAERLRKETAARPVKGKDMQIAVTVSVGLTIGLAKDDSTLLLTRAENTVNACHIAGGNQVHLHDGRDIRQLAPTALVGAGR